jgi:hypothetical protein
MMFPLNGISSSGPAKLQYARSWLECLLSMCQAQCESAWMLSTISCAELAPSFLGCISEGSRRTHLIARAVAVLDHRNGRVIMYGRLLATAGPYLQKAAMYPLTHTIRQRKGIVK